MTKKNYINQASSKINEDYHDTFTRMAKVEALEREYADEDGYIDYKRLYGRGGPLDSSGDNYVFKEDE